MTTQILLSIVSSVIAGVILAYIIQDARFDPSRSATTQPQSTVSQVETIVKDEDATLQELDHTTTVLPTLTPVMLVETIRMSANQSNILPPEYSTFNGKLSITLQSCYASPIGPWSGKGVALFVRSPYREGKKFDRVVKGDVFLYDGDGLYSLEVIEIVKDRGWVSCDVELEITFTSE
jgi:hypothetical protein